MIKKTPQWKKKSTHDYTVLIIEDDHQFREFLADLLDAAGFKVEQATDGDAGIKQFQTNPPHLVITDIVMPGIDGLEVISTIKKSHPEIPVIAIASTLNKPHKQGFLSLALMKGADAVLGKPFKMAELTDTINRLLNESIALLDPKIKFEGSSG